MLTTVNLNLEALRPLLPPEGVCRLEECVQVVNRAIEQVRSLSLDLRPTSLDALGLEAAARLTREQLLAELAALRQRNAVLEHAEAARRASEAYAQGIFETAREPLLLLDEALRVLAANRAFYETFRVEPGETVNRFVYELGDSQWNIPRLRGLLEEVIPRNTFLRDFEVESPFPHIGHKAMLLNARRVSAPDGRPLVLLAIEDATGRKQVEQERRQPQEQLEQQVRERTAELEAANRELEAFAYSVSHDLRSPLRALDGYTRILLEDYAACLPPVAQEYVRDVRRNAQKMGQLILPGRVQPPPV